MGVQCEDQRTTFAGRKAWHLARGSDALAATTQAGDMVGTFCLALPAPRDAWEHGSDTGGRRAVPRSGRPPCCHDRRPLPHQSAQAAFPHLE